jgi:hypothetical protein
MSLSQLSATDAVKPVPPSHQTRSVTKQQANIAAYTKSLSNLQHDISIQIKNSTTQSVLPNTVSSPHLASVQPNATKGLSVSSESLSTNTVSRDTSPVPINRSRSNSLPSQHSQDTTYRNTMTNLGDDQHRSNDNLCEGREDQPSFLFTSHKQSQQDDAYAFSKQYDGYPRQSNIGKLQSKTNTFSDDELKSERDKHLQLINQLQSQLLSLSVDLDTTRKRHADDLHRELQQRDITHLTDLRALVKDHHTMLAKIEAKPEPDKLLSISDTIIGPKPWVGSSSEDPEIWLEYFDNYCKFRDLDKKAQLRLFTILMRDGASVWLQTLPTDTVKSLESLVQAFKDNYCRSPELKFQEASALWSCPQKPTEPFNDYLTRLRRGARRLNVSDELLNFALVNGLRAPIKSHVLSQGVGTLQDTIKSARIAEATVSTDPISALLTESIKATLEASERQAQQIKELTSQVSTLSVAAQASIQVPTAAALSQPSKSRPQEERPRYSTHQRSKPQTQNYNQPRDYQPRFVKQTPQNLQRANYGRSQGQYHSYQQ